MDFKELNEWVPHVVGAKLYVQTYKPYPNITLMMPGRHQADTNPIGGDFVVCVDDNYKDWTQHQFSHVDIFHDIYQRQYSSFMKTEDFLRLYMQVVQGHDPAEYEGLLHNGIGTAMDPNTFFYAVQCLAVAEYRRYARFESKFGGRYLPFRFAAGIVEGKWTVSDATARQRAGRPGVEQLEKEFGTPQLTKELFNG
jgi:hypothetical protein